MYIGSIIDNIEIDELAKIEVDTEVYNNWQWLTINETLNLTNHRDFAKSSKYNLVNNIYLLYNS